MQIQLPPLLVKPSEKLPHLALDGPENERPPLCLHNVGLIRWVFEEARDLHLARGEYQARQSDPQKQERMHAVIFREVCGDILAATRKCCKAYRAVETMRELAGHKAHARHRAMNRFQGARTKLRVAGTLNKMLRKEHEQNIEAEKMWSECCEGLSLSLSLCAKQFASKSLGVRSLRVGDLPCGSISLGLRKYRRSSPKGQEGNSEFMAGARC